MSNASDTELFVKSCSEAARYPQNLVYHDTYEHNLRAYVRRLDVREEILFCTDRSSVLDLWEFDEKLASMFPEAILAAGFIR